MIALVIPMKCDNIEFVLLYIKHGNETLNLLYRYIQSTNYIFYI